MIHCKSQSVTSMSLKCAMKTGALEAFWRLCDARAEIAAVNESMKMPLITWLKWRGPARYNACLEPCDNWNGPCVCGAWHKDGR